jgi:hypothetical protein
MTELIPITKTLSGIPLWTRGPRGGLGRLVGRRCVPHAPW